jgi:shikimate 5-dehydrogenase
LPITSDARKADRQTPTGAEALVIGAGGDPAAVGRALEKELAQVGVAGPCVQVRMVDRLERQAAGNGSAKPRC